MGSPVEAMAQAVKMVPGNVNGGVGVGVGGGSASASASASTSAQPATSILEEMKLRKEIREQADSRRNLNPELWHACAGPLVSLPQIGSLVYYFPQGHSEQVAVSTKGSAIAQIPNYPNLPSQLMCQVHSETLHADRETNDIYAQMSLQPVTSEKDVFPVPDFGLRPSKHPTEFFCKTLTASDTSTHGGFSVPRRAAEKLFPPLDYTTQPPSQEIVVRDLHDNVWNFRHIFRGQPKRHLLTTGWSLFVGSIRLRAGDSVLFIRDEKSQLMVGVRRANCQPTPPPSSVLTTEGMHIGILAAAAHAATCRSSFTTFYNPRSCPAEFIVPLAKYRKAVHGTRISAGMRFGMMFETEESAKRRYMGTVTGISDLDPQRWSGSKWRNLQVEWDEPDCGDKPNRVSPWEIETPESLLLFPSLTAGLKRPCHSGLQGGEIERANVSKRHLIASPEITAGSLMPCRLSPTPFSEQLLRMLQQPQLPHPVPRGSPLPDAAYPDSGLVNQMLHSVQVANNPPLLVSSPKHYPETSESPEARAATKSPAPLKTGDQLPMKTNPENLKVDPAIKTNQLNQLTAPPPSIFAENSATGQLIMPNQSSTSVIVDQTPCSTRLQSVFHPQLDSHSLHGGSSPFVNVDDYSLYTSCSQSLPNFLISPSAPLIFGLQESSAFFADPPSHLLPSSEQEYRDHSGNYVNNLRVTSQANLLPMLPEHDPIWLKDSSDESINQSGVYNGLNLGVRNACSSVLDTTVSSAILDELCNVNDTSFLSPPDCMVGKFDSSHDPRSHITVVGCTDQPDSSGTCSSNVDFDESSMLKSSISWQPQVATPVRTYTKVQKTGSVGRSIDVTNFKNYNELLTAIELMFGLEGLLSDTRGSGWILVYVDFENDVLLVGDDPWEEFVGCVRCIRILSPVEVRQMSEEGMMLLKAAAGQGLNA